MSIRITSATSAAATSHESVLLAVIIHVSTDETILVETKTPSRTFGDKKSSVLLRQITI